MKKDNVLAIPVLVLTIGVIVYGILLFRAYKEPGFIFLICIYCGMVFLTSLFLYKARPLLIKVIEAIPKLDYVILALGVGYVFLLIGIMIVMEKKLLNDVYVRDYLVFILMGMIVSCYNMYLYVLKLKKG